MHVCYGVFIAPGKIFENFLQLKRFGFYFEGNLSRKWLYFHIEIIISAKEMLGVRGRATQARVQGGAKEPAPPPPRY